MQMPENEQGVRKLPLNVLLERRRKRKPMDAPVAFGRGNKRKERGKHAEGSNRQATSALSAAAGTVTAA